MYPENLGVKEVMALALADALSRVKEKILSVNFHSSSTKPIR
jgi:hypothetical protein